MSFDPCINTLIRPIGFIVYTLKKKCYFVAYLVFTDLKFLLLGEFVLFLAPQRQMHPLIFLINAFDMIGSSMSFTSESISETIADFSEEDLLTKLDVSN